MNAVSHLSSTATSNTCLAAALTAVGDRVVPGWPGASAALATPVVMALGVALAARGLANRERAG